MSVAPFLELPLFADSLLNPAFRAIPADLQPSQIEVLLPHNYQELFVCSLDEKENLILIFNRSEISSPEVRIPRTLFNPSHRPTSFPKFILEISSSSTVPVDYLGADNQYCLNQNQILTLLLKARCDQYLAYPANTLYTGLMSKDIKNLMSYIGYVRPNTFNAQRKVDNAYVILSPNSVYPQSIVLNNCFGNWFTACDPSEANWPKIMNDLPMCLTSASSLSKTSTVTLSANPNEQMYRSVGYVEYKNTASHKFVKCIFKSAQNIPSRVGCHIIADAYSCVTPDRSVFQQDNVIVKLEDGTLRLDLKDNCSKEAIVVFHPMNQDNLRFAGGEIEITNQLSEVLIIVNKTLEIEFKDMNLVEGQVFVAIGSNPVTLGYDLEDHPIELNSVKKCTILGIEPSSINNTYKLRTKLEMTAGNARITSNTGLKGVTKVRPYLGKIQFAEDQTAIHAALVEQFAHHHDVDLNVCSGDLQPVFKESEFILPDLVTGMNAVKAHGNTIALAQAALAVKLGYYKPVSKAGFDNLLNSLNEAEINEAAQSLPIHKYTNEYGVEVPVYVGLVYVNYTEIAGVYSKMSPQPFMFETGKFIYYNNVETPELYDYIWNNCIDKTVVGYAKELYKILIDRQSAFAQDGNIPVYTIDEVINDKMFVEDDYVLTKKSLFPAQSKLLDPEWNKGFYLDFSKHGGPCFRIPSADMFNHFSGQLGSNEFIYSDLLIIVSKILQTSSLRRRTLRSAGIFHVEAEKQMSNPNLLVSRYLNTVQSVLYSGEEASMKVVQTLIKPMIMGFSMKQVVEPLLPDDVLLVLDDRKFRQCVKIATDGKQEAYFTQQALQSLALIGAKKDSLALDAYLKECPRGIAARNPMLWKLQVKFPRIWNRQMYQAYLKAFHGIDLHNYLTASANTDLLLVSTKIVFDARSDADGDLLPVSILAEEGQMLLRGYVDAAPLDVELQWSKDYLAAELKNDLRLYPEGAHHVYKLFDIPLKNISAASDKQVTPFYAKYLFNASIAKSNIGPATLDIWTLTCVMEMYRELYKSTGGKYTLRGNQVNLLPLSMEDLVYLTHMYTRLVQEKVIEGIKHVVNGSKDFEIFYLDNISSSANQTAITKILLSEFQMSRSMINKLLFVVRYAFETDLLKACRNFISLYNKGRLPRDLAPLEKWECQISEHTYLGKLVKDLFDIRTDYRDICDKAAFDFDAENLQHMGVHTQMIDVII